MHKAIEAAKQPRTFRSEAWKHFDLLCHLESVVFAFQLKFAIGYNNIVA